MARVSRGRRDQDILALKRALDEYETKHPGADASLYRQNGSAIRIRIVDDGFKDTSKARRHDTIWDYLTKQVGEQPMAKVSMLLLLDPQEATESLMNLEFEQPLPSRL